MKKKLFLIPTFIAGMTLVACGGNTPKPTEEYNVSLKMTEAMNIDNVKAKSDTDYDTKITVKDDFTGYCAVPEALYEVHVNGVQLEGEQYTYTRDSDSQARLHIPSNNVTGDIEIFAEAKADTIDIELLDDAQNLSIDRKEAIVGSGCEINMSLSSAEAEKTLSVPNRLDDLEIICKDSHDQKEYNLTQCCTYTKNDDTSAKLIIPAKYNGVVVITGKVTISASAYQPTYTFKEGKIENINIGAPANSPAKGVECSFNINTSGEYIIPADLEIKVGGDLLHKSMGDYQITGGDQSANVKIVGEKVNGDIVVSGRGQKVAKAEVKYYLGGIMEPTNKEAEVGKNFTCELKPIDGSLAPTADNIRVKIGDSKDADKWIIPNAGQDTKVTFDGENLTISGDLIKSTSETIHIAAKAANVKLLEFYSSQGDWASVETAANLGYAEYLFEIGEESVPFTLNDSSSNSYRIRILGFNKDKNYLYENKAGITFEFTSGVSEQYFGKSVSGKTYSSYYYKKGSEYGYQCDLYDYLNSTLYNVLPFKKYVNNIRKYTVAGSYATVDADKEKIMESGNYLFPLSLKEMGLDSTISGEFDKEGPSGTNQAYPYYAKGGSLVKTDGVKPITYWLRSPANIKNPQIYTISTLGARASASARGQKLYVAPAFCF